MHFDECQEGHYRIYVGALESPLGDGYTAALVVSRRGGPGAPHTREAYRDDSLACGYRWPSAQEALQYALARGRELVRSRPEQLSC